jgi:UDP-glucose 4-epimerase
MEKLKYMERPDMKIAIMGGAGFIGSHLAHAYLNAGNDVFVIDSLTSGSQQVLDPRARFYHVDIRDKRLQDILLCERPDMVSHHVTQQHETGTGAHTLADADVHVRGLINVLDSCVNASVKRFIFASGGNNLYGRVEAEQLPLAEVTPLHPRSAQDISKAAGEWYVRYYSQQYGLKHTIMRYADIYGEKEPLRFRHPLSYFVRMLHEQQRPVIRGTGNEIKDHIFIDDVVEAHLYLLKELIRGENRTFHISSGQGYSLKQLYNVAARVQNSQLEPVYIAGTHLVSSAIVLDNTQARLALDWQPQITLLEGVRQATQRILQQNPKTPQMVTSPQLRPYVIQTAESTLTHA